MTEVPSRHAGDGPEPAYLPGRRVVTVQDDHRYNPKYGDDRACVCGHAYHRHFDSYEGMSPVGCKYCQCDTFVAAAPADVLDLVRLALVATHATHGPRTLEESDHGTRGVCKLQPFGLDVDGLTQQDRDFLTAFDRETVLALVARADAAMPTVVTFPGSSPDEEELREAIGRMRDQPLQFLPTGMTYHPADDHLPADADWLRARIPEDPKEPPNHWRAFSGLLAASFGGRPRWLRFVLAVDGHLSVSLQNSASSSFDYLVEGPLTRGRVRCLVEALTDDPLKEV